MKSVVGWVALCILMSACTYSQNGCLVGHYCLVPFDGGSVNASDWTPTANATGPVNVVAAKCDMLAHSSVPSLDEGMTQVEYVQDTIRDCMMINGFQRNH
jgi:hypothetical protein